MYSGFDLLLDYSGINQGTGSLLAKVFLEGMVVADLPPPVTHLSMSSADHKMKSVIH